MRVSLALAAAVLLAGCAESGPGSTSCTMTLAGEGADPSLQCAYGASPTFVRTSENGGPSVETWGLGIDGLRAQQDLAVSALVVFDPGVEPVAGITYACEPGSEPTAPWRAYVDRWSPTALTHSMHPPHSFTDGQGSLSVTFTSVTSSSSLDAPTHGALDATLVANDGSGKTLALHVEF